jgi:4-amino-4-deoxy-L-arabinose transferase-like glycosyltransferase
MSLQALSCLKKAATNTRPLSRLSAALLPYLAGFKGVYRDDIWSDGFYVIRGLSLSDYQLRLSLARLGILPYLFTSALVVFFWTRSLSGNRAAPAATTIYLTIPALLAHGTLATTDGTLTCMLLASGYALDRWLRVRSWGRTIILGIFIGLALAAKMTALLFGVCLMSAALLTLKCYKVITNLHSLRLLVAAALIVTMTLWTCYRFDVTALSKSKRADEVISLLPESGWGVYARAFLDTPIPLARYFTGIASTVRHSREGHAALFLGEVRTKGWWYFFPIVFLIKTPIWSLLLLALALASLSFKSIRKRITGRLLFPITSALLIFLVVMPSSINIGLRHILPVYGLLIIGSAALLSIAADQLRRFTYAIKIFFTSIITAQVIECLSIFPFYISYYNQLPKLIGLSGYQIVCNSDYDWGQEALMLGEYLRAQGIEHFYYAGATWTAPDDTMILPKHTKPTADMHGIIVTNRCFSAADGVPFPEAEQLRSIVPIKTVADTTLIYELK